jgi:hypothetical protein
MTDSAGRVRVAAPRWEESAHVVLPGPGHVPLVRELEDWKDGQPPLTVRVAESATVVGRVGPVEAVNALDASTPEEVKEFGRFGRTANEWRRSIEDLRGARRPGIALHTGEPGESIWMERVFPIDEQGRFVLRDAPTGKWRLVLVVWQRRGNTVSREVRETLGEVELIAGPAKEVELRIPEGLTGARR